MSDYTDMDKLILRMRAEDDRLGPLSIALVLQRLKAGDPLPDGNKVAPVKPTGVMLAAAFAAAPDVRSDDVWAIYEAMLAAASTD